MSFLKPKSKPAKPIEPDEVTPTSPLPVPVDLSPAPEVIVTPPPETMEPLRAALEQIAATKDRCCHGMHDPSHHKCVVGIAQRALKGLALVALVVGVGLVGLPRSARGADFLYGVELDAGSGLLLNADGGTTAKMSGLIPNTQFMVNYATYSGVRYRACKTSVCTAGPYDAPIDSDKQVDLCLPSGYTTVSFYRAVDGGSGPIYVYLTTPNTVCPPP